MAALFQLLAAISFCVAVLVSPVALWLGFRYLFLTTNSTVLGDEVWKRPRGVAGWFYNPHNRILQSSRLTPEGLVYRRQLCWSIAAFVGPILAALLVKAIAEAL